MRIIEAEFNYKPKDDYGDGMLSLTDEREYHYFYFEFTAFQDRDCAYGCHSSTQEQPDELYYEFDVIDKIKDLDALVHKIEVVFGEENLKDKIENFIRTEFDNIGKARYLYTREG